MAIIKYKDKFGAWKNLIYATGGADINSGVVGCYGYYYSCIDLKNKDIWLSETQVTPTITTKITTVDETVCKFDPNYELPYAVGDVFSIVNGSHYDYVGTITAIVGNRITYESDKMTFTETASDSGQDAYSFYVPSKPTLGVTQVTTGLIAAGDTAIAAGNNSIAMGRDVEAGGDYSVVLGRRLLAAYCSAAFGLGNKALEKYSIIAGWENKSSNINSATFGGGLINPYENGTIVGWCNDPTITDLLFGVGDGFSHNGGRHNAFNVDMYGNVFVGKEQTMQMGVATVGYVEEVRQNCAPLHIYVEQTTNGIVEGQVVDCILPYDTLEDYIQTKTIMYHLEMTSGKRLIVPLVSVGPVSIEGVLHKQLRFETFYGDGTTSTRIWAHINVAPDGTVTTGSSNH